MSDIRVTQVRCQGNEVTRDRFVVLGLLSYIEIASGEGSVSPMTILRDYINATVGFAGLADATHIPPKSLMRMFSPAGNPRAFRPCCHRRKQQPCCSGLFLLQTSLGSVNK
jgi:hypothetical protein